MMEALLDIGTFWYGKTLRDVDRLCLLSMLKAGHRVRLYSYEEIENLPKGITSSDAREILPLSVLKRIDPNFPDYKPLVTIAQFSDFFRVFLMQKGGMVWLDTDVYLVKPFLVNPKEIWLAHESKSRLGISAFYLPPDNIIFKEFERYLASDKILPDWLGFKRRVVKPFYFKLKQIQVTPGRVGITVFGNDGMSRLAKKYGFFHKAHKKESFYYWHARESEKIFDPRYGLEPLKHEDFIGFHIHYKRLSHQPPKEGSFYHWAVQRIPEFEGFVTA